MKQPFTREQLRLSRVASVALHLPARLAVKLI
jgi:hypothetical protein